MPKDWPNLSDLLRCVAWSSLLLAGSAAANTPDFINRLRCAACHSGQNQHVLDGKPRRSQSSTINLADFRDADHGKIHCPDCHAKGFDIFPHRNKKTETCMDCHPRTGKGADADKPYEFHRMLEEFEGTVHFTEYRHAREKCCGTAAGEPAAPASSAGGGPVPDLAKAAAQRFTCEHCHEPHYFKATRRIGEPRLIRANDNGPCLHCHMDGASVPLSDPAKPSLLAAHGYLPYAELHLEGTRCIDCHTTVRMTVAHDLPKGKGADQGCNTCHSIDSVLLGRLYRYAENTGTRLGFHNARLLEDGYVMGANRHRWTDIAAYLLVSIGLALVLAHGGWRIGAWWQRRTALGRTTREARP
jgi:hypothetical protein